MRTARSRIAVWCCLLLVVLTASGCFSDPSKPNKKPAERLDWISATTTSEQAGVVIEKVAYRSGDLTINGQVCRPAGGGSHPVLISNHAGFAGLPDWDAPNGFCARAAKTGWVVAESSYRGEDGSDGRIEVCKGEVDDVLAMLGVVREQSYADPDRIAMMGLSHGGCITARAVERGVDVDLAVDIAGPTDWSALTRALKNSEKDSSVNPALQALNKDLVSSIEKAVGGTPEQYPKRYEARSADAEKIARWDKPFLIMHGGADSIVPVQQSCALANQVGGFEAYRFAASGRVESQPPTGCEELKWNDAPTPVRTFDADRYLLVYDGVDHLLVAANGLTRMLPDLLRFLEAKLPAA
jgi:dienelactone hydrolase